MLANILRQIHPPGTRSLLSYTGASPALVTDADGTPSYVGNIDLQRDAVLMGVQGWSLDLESYRVTIARTNEPSISSPWWISTNGGTTRRRAIARYKQPGIWQGQITHWWVYLQLDPEA